MFTMTQPPASEVLTLAQAKGHLRITIDAEDDYITALITAARMKCESYLNRSFLTTGWTITFDGFPGQWSRYSPALGTFALGSYGYGMGPLYGYIPERFLYGTGEPIIIPKARLQAVQSLTYVNPEGNLTTLDPSQYTVEPGDGGRIAPGYMRVWPQARVYPGSITITFTIGYGSDPTAVPLTIQQAILMYIGHLYENREATTDLGLEELPMGVKWLLAAEDWGLRP